ncbi:MAG: hypothetical protein J5753_00710, partial [Oscillospiraceae bacterium]|nr:hypothetical protein [Oscillospiraceae bacterium]
AGTNLISTIPFYSFIHFFLNSCEAVASAKKHLSPQVLFCFALQQMRKKRPIIQNPSENRPDILQTRR